MPVSTPPQTLWTLPGSQPLFVLSLESARGTEALPAAEREVAEAVLAGMSNEEIAARRGTSVKTVANQLARLYERFDVHSRAALSRALDLALGAP
jgi:DNA-binding NarL/FixJ family response regulator